MELEKIAAHINHAAIHCKKQLSEQYPSATLEVSIFERCDGANKWKVFSIAGKEFEAPDNSLSNVYKISRMLKDACEELNAKRGYIVGVIKKDIWYQTRDIFGNTWRSESVPMGLVFLRKPCKEFELLRRYLRKYANMELNDLDLYSVSVCGKRGSNYEECGERHYYAHNPRRCIEITSWIAKNRKPGCRIIANIEKRRDCGDGEYSRYQETESYGTVRRSLIIRIVKNGQTISKHDFT